MAEGKPGRLSLLSKDVSTAIATRVAGGVPQKHAARAAGIAERTVRAWIAQGKRDERNGIESEFSAFHAAIQEAKAQFVQSIVLEIRAAGMGGRKITETITTQDANGTVTGRVIRERTTPPDWRALFAMLERRYPADFGPDRKEMADLRKLVQELLKRLDAAGG